MKMLMDEKLNEIEIPDSLHERCRMGVVKAKQETDLHNSKSEGYNRKEIKKQMKKIAAAAAVLVCVLAVGNTTMADGVKGYFKDIMRFDGAITGSEYVGATDEVAITVGEITAAETEVLVPMEITFLNPETVPFSEIEWIEVDAFEILNADGETVVSEDEANVVCSVSEGYANLLLEIEADKLASGETYTLVIEIFEGCKKADQPLAVKGEWKCVFEVK